jgi:hypothetical protein
MAESYGALPQVALGQGVEVGGERNIVFLSNPEALIRRKS